MDITDGVAVVTGGASGLGLATARTLAEAGARVALLDLPRSDGEQAAKEFDDGAVFTPADVADEDEVRDALDLAAELGPIRVVVNCAGIGNAIRTVGKNGAFPLADFQRVVEVNLIGTFNVLRLGAERISHTDPVGEERGVIVNT